MASGYASYHHYMLFTVQVMLGANSVEFCRPYWIIPWCCRLSSPGWKPKEPFWLRSCWVANLGCGIDKNWGLDPELRESKPSQLYQFGDIKQCTETKKTTCCLRSGLGRLRFSIAAPKVQEEEKPGAMGDQRVRHNLALKLSSYSLKPEGNQWF